MKRKKKGEDATTIDRGGDVATTAAEAAAAARNDGQHFPIPTPSITMEVRSSNIRSFIGRPFSSSNIDSSDSNSNGIQNDQKISVTEVNNY